MDGWGTSEGSDIMPRIGEVIGGKYRLVRELGAGGMGAVYEGVHVEIGSRAAVKFLNPRYFGDPEAASRFQREARAAAAIGHDAIIGIYDLGRTPAGLPYIVMELLTGQPLGDRLHDHGPLEIPMVAYILCQTLSGLHAAHQEYIVHRDLKPDNIFLVETGAIVPGVKVLDFGISKVLGHESLGQQRSSLTQTGTVLGTPEYMSPEQARGDDDIDHRADIFAAGVILYECLTGQVPFTGNNYNQVMLRIIQEPPAPAQMLRDDIPPAFERALDRALAKERDDRYPSALEMFNDIVELVDDHAMGRISFPTPPLQPILPAAERAETGETTAELVAGDSEDDTALFWKDGQQTLDELRRRQRRRVLVAAAAMLIVAGGTVGAIFGLGDRQATPRAPLPEETAALIGGGEDREASVETTPNEEGLQPGPVEAPDGGVPETPEAAPPVVTVHLRGLPRGARVLLDDVPVDDNPLVLPRSGRTRRLTVLARGYRPYRARLVADEDQDIDVSLRPRRGRPDPRPAKSGAEGSLADEYEVPYIDEEE